MDTISERSAQDSFFKTTADAINALLKQYEQNGAFVDRDKLTGEGVLPNAIGLTGVMLPLVAFGGKDRGRVITKENQERIGRVAADLVPKLYEGVREDGYLFAPIYSKGKTAKIFSVKDHIGATDTVTWVLSVSILIWYAQRKGLMKLAPELRDQTAFLIADALKTLLDAQRSADGSWGFGTWPAAGKQGQAERSLYYTYSASTTIADFLYYVRGDIDNPNEDPGVDCEKYWDAELLERLNAELGMDVLKAVLDARAKMQMWLLKDCLPLLPKLASCKALTPEENRILGIWDSASDRSSGGEYNYFNLYYTYYLIDMMISSEVDLLFRSFDFPNTIGSVLTAEGDCGIPGAELLRSYRDNPAFSENDLLYYFGLDTSGIYREEEQHVRELFDNSLQQAIHDSRAMYLSARRTRSFWAQSELRVEWRHENNFTNTDVQKLGSRVTDPAFAPMALRANTIYVYYITQKPDYVLNTLYESIRQEAYHPEELREALGDAFDEELYESCVPDLWDTENYSLFVTERSIEALVDYFDYIIAYETPAEPVVQTEIRVEKSGFETAVDEKIRDYLRSPEGMAAIAEAVGQQSAAAPAVGTEASVEDALRAFLKTASRDLKQAYADSTEPDERIALLVTCFERLQSASMLKKVRKHEKEHNGLAGTELNSRADASSKMLQTQLADLLDTLLERMDPNNSMAWLFEKLMNAAQDSKI